MSSSAGHSSGVNISQQGTKSTPGRASHDPQCSQERFLLGMQSSWRTGGVLHPCSVTATQPQQVLHTLPKVLISLLLLSSLTWSHFSLSLLAKCKKSLTQLRHSLMEAPQNWCRSIHHQYSRHQLSLIPVLSPLPFLLLPSLQPHCSFVPWPGTVPHCPHVHRAKPALGSLTPAQTKPFSTFDELGKCHTKNALSKWSQNSEILTSQPLSQPVHL